MKSSQYILRDPNATDVILTIKRYRKIHQKGYVNINVNYKKKLKVNTNEIIEHYGQASNPISLIVNYSTKLGNYMKTVLGSIVRTPYFRKVEVVESEWEENR